MVNDTFNVGLLSGGEAPAFKFTWNSNEVKCIHKCINVSALLTCILTIPLMFGSFAGSTLPTSQVRTLLTGSKVYFPCVALSVQFSTAFGIGTSRRTDSSCLPMVCLGPTVISNFPEVPLLPAAKCKLCRKYSGIATTFWLPMRYDMRRKLPSGGMKDSIRSASHLKNFWMYE